MFNEKNYELTFKNVYYFWQQQNKSNERKINNYFSLTFQSISLV